MFASKEHALTTSEGHLSSKRTTEKNNCRPEQKNDQLMGTGTGRCIGRESNPGLADIRGSEDPRDGNGQFYH
jgi:hypothetical protein